MNFLNEDTKKLKFTEIQISVPEIPEPEEAEETQDRNSKILWIKK